MKKFIISNTSVFILLVLFFAGARNAHATDLYAIKNNGNWNDGATWTTDPADRSTCGCTPTANDNVHIGDNGPKTIDLNVDGYATNVTIYDKGTLKWVGNNRELYIRNGGTLDVQSGSELDENGNDAARIYIVDANASFIVNGTVIIDDIYLQADNITFNNNVGTITVGRHFLAESSSTNLDFTNAGTILINGADDSDLRIDGAGSSFTNTGSVTLNGTGGDIYLRYDDITFANNTGTITVGRHILTDATSTNLDFTNSGTILLNGAGDSDIRIDGAGSAFTNTNNISLTGSEGDIYVRGADITFNNNGGDISIGRQLYTSSVNLDFTNSGTISLNSASSDGSDIYIDGVGSSFTNSGDITIKSTTGDFRMRADGITFNNDVGGNLDIERQFIGESSSTNLDFTNSGTITLTAATNDASDFYIDGAGSTFTNTNDIILNSTTGDFRIRGTNIIFNNNGGNISVGRQFIGESGSTNLDFTNSGTITLTAATNDASDFYIQGPGTSFTNSGDIILNSTVGDFRLRAADITFNNDGGNITLPRVFEVHSSATNFNMTNSGTISLTHATDGWSDLYIAAAGASITNTNTITLHSSNGDIQFRANDITLNNSGNISCMDLNLYEDRGSVINSGTLTISDDINAGGGDDDNTITNDATGTITVDSRIGLDGLTLRFRINNSGTFNLAEEISAGSSTPADAPTWYNYAGATANFGNDKVDKHGRLLLFANYADNTINYNGTQNQDIITPQDAYWDITLSGTNTKKTHADLDINGKVTISGDARLDPDNKNNDLTVAGDWTNTSTNADAFDQGTESVTFDGSNVQAITSTSGETFYNLIFNNAAGFTGSGDISTTAALTMNAGNIDMGTDKLVLGDDPTNEGIFNYTTGTIIGKFERWIANSSTSTYNFPVGTSSNKNNVQIDLNAGTSGGSLTFEYIQTDPGTAGMPLLDDLTTMSNAFSDGYWPCTVANGFNNTNYDLVLDGSGMISQTIDQYTRILTRPGSGADWAVQGIHLPGADPLVFRAGMTTLPAEFGFGTPDAPPVITTWYTYSGGGNWNDANTWTQDGTGSTQVPVGGGVPAATDEVVIRLGDDVAMDIDNVNIRSMELLGNLYVGSTSGHNFRLISGKGKMYLEGSGGIDNFPDGVTSLFANAANGGTVEYQGAGLTLDQQREFNHFILKLDNNSDELILLNDLKINGDFTITKGEFQINDNTETSILNLTVSGTAFVDTDGSIMVGQGNTIGSYVHGSTMPATGEFHNIFHQVVFGGDFTNNGIVRFTNQAAPVYDQFSTTGAATVEFVGANNNTMNLFGTTDFYNLIINKGNDQTYELEVSSDNAANFVLYGPNSAGRVSSSPFSSSNPEVRKALWIYNGTLHLTGNISIPTLSEGAQSGGNGDYPIGQNGALWIDGENVYVYSTADDLSQVPAGASGINKSGGSSNQALSLYGFFRISDGFFGTRASGGFIFWDDAAGTVMIEGGIVNVSQFRSHGGGTATNSYIQSGGTLIVRSNIGQSGEVSGGYALFSMHLPEGVFNMSGGTLQVYGERGGGSVFINSGEGRYSVTGGDLIVENRNDNNAKIASTVPFWNVTLAKNGGDADSIKLITNTIQGETILDPDLIVLNNFTIKDGVTFDHNGNDVTVGSDFIIRNGGDYLYKSSKPNTTTMRGNDDCLLVFENRTLADANDEQKFWNMVIDRPSGTKVTLQSGKTGSALNGYKNNVLSILGDHFKLLSGTFDQGPHSIRMYCDTLVNYDKLTLYNTLGASNDANAHSQNDLIKFRTQPIVMITADTSVIGNLKLNNGDKILTLNSDLYLKRLEFEYGRLNMQNHNLKVDTIDFIVKTYGQANYGGCGGCISVEDMLITSGNSSDKGLSIYIHGDGIYEFPFGIGTSQTEPSSKYTPALVTVSNFSDDGYITIRPVDKALATTNNVGDILSYHWRVDYEGFTDKPKVQYEFTYHDDDLDLPSNVGLFVPGKVLDGSPFTRSKEHINNFSVSNNTITFNGDEDDSGANPFELEEANYTAGESTRFDGQVKVYYTRRIGDAAQMNWQDLDNWTTISDSNLDPHDSGQGSASDYPKAGDIAYVGWVPWDDASGNDLGKPHGIEINRTESAAEIRFTQMTDDTPEKNPVARVYAYNFQFRPTVCVNPNGVVNAGRVQGEGAFWFRSTDSQVDPDLSNVDMGLFALEDSSYMIYESTNDLFIYDNIPSEVPNLMIASNGWGGNDRDFEISTDVTIKKNFELFRNINLVLSSGASGDILVENDLIMLKESGAEIAFPHDASRTIEVLGDLLLTNQDAKINIRGTETTGVISELIVHGDIIQDNNNGGLLLNNESGDYHINLTLKGAGNNKFEQLSGDDAKFYTLTVDKGSGQSSSFSFNGNFTLEGPKSGVGVPKALILANGKVIINNSAINIDLSTGDDDFNIPATAALQVSDGQVSVSGDNSGITLDGSLIIDGGTVDMSNGAGNGNNYIEYSASENAKIEISDGSLLVGSQIRGNLDNNSSILDYTQTGGTVVIGKNAAPEASRSVLEVHNTGSNFTYTGGTLTLVRQNTSAPEVAALRLLPTFSDITRTIYIGNANTPDSQTSFGINANVPLSGVTISGDANFPTAVIEINPLIIGGTLTIDAGATLDAKGIQLTLEGDFVNDGTFTPSDNLTVFAAETSQIISGTGTTDFYNFEKTGGGILNTSIPFTVNNLFTLSEGVFDDNSNAVDLLGIVLIDAAHQSTGNAGDGLRFSGSSGQQLSRSTSGSSSMGIVTIQNPNGVVIPEGNGYNFNIDGELKLNNGIFNIGSSAVALGEDALITTTSAFSSGNMVKTNSSFTDNGLIKTFPMGYSNAFTYPIGEAKYTPVIMDFSVAGGTSGSSVGSIAVRSANEFHPTVNDGIDNVTGEDINNVMQYYWSLIASNVTGFVGDVKFYYDDLDVALAGGDLESDYIPARILSYNNPTYEISKFDASYIDASTNEITFNSTEVFNGVPSDGITGDYFAGIDPAIPPNVATYTVQGIGGEVENLVYDKVVPGGGAPKGAVVIIPSGTTLSLAIDNVHLYKTEIQDGGVLEINDSKFHRLGIIEGIGTLKIVHNDTDNPSFPAGDYGTFFSCAGGGIEYAGTGSYNVLGGIPNIRNLTFSGSGDRDFPNSNVTVCENLTISGATLNLASDWSLSINDDALLVGGIVNAPASSNGEFNVNGDFDIDGGTFNGNSSGKTNIYGTLSLESGTLNVGSSTYEFNIWGNFNKTGGTFDGGSGNAVVKVVTDGSRNASSVISGDFTGASKFFNLEIDKASTGQSLTANGDIEVENRLTLTDGLINTNTELILGSAATVSPANGQSNSYINGKVIKTIANADGSFTFPIGSATRWRPAYVEKVSSGGMAWEAEYFEGAATIEGIVTNLNPSDPSILTISSNEYWKISDGNVGHIGVTATVGLSWGIESNVSVEQSQREQLELVVWNTTDSDWDNYGGSSFSASHSQSQGSLISSSEISFSENIITLSSSDLANPLPVELVSFTGKEKDEKIVLYWKTASELNNDYFIIEHSVDGKVFSEIGDMAGAGTTSIQQYYSFTHIRPAYANNYYRLKQVDFDGAFEYSEIIVVRINKLWDEEKLDFVLYPNPTSDPNVNIELSALDFTKPLHVEVINMNGMKIVSESYDAGNFDRLVNLNLAYGTKQGIYMVRIIQNDHQVVKKLILN